MERKFLPGRFVNGEDAAVLCGAVFDHRDQLHLSSDPGAEDDRQLENADTGEIPVRAESAPEDHALVQAEGLRRHPRIFLQSRGRPWRKTRTGPVPIAADLQERGRRVELIPAGVSVNARSIRVSS